MYKNRKKTAVYKRRNNTENNTKAQSTQRENKHTNKKTNKKDIEEYKSRNSKRKYRSK
jgi:hypothetical protein